MSATTWTMKLNDDHVYLVMLIFSIVFGSVTRNIGNTTLRKWTSSLVGLAVIFSVSGYHTIHPIVSFVIHASLINLVPKANVHWINFFVGFAYLVKSLKSFISKKM
jgi:lysophospholipid acyltransferase 7